MISLPVATTTTDRRACGPRPGRSEMKKGSRILVVDDNVDTAGSLARLLTLLGNDVQVRTSWQGGH